MKTTWKKMTGSQLFLPFLALIVVLLVNLLRSPDFFAIMLAGWGPSSSEARYTEISGSVNPKSLRTD